MGVSRGERESDFVVAKLSLHLSGSTVLVFILRAPVGGMSNVVAVVAGPWAVFRRQSMLHWLVGAPRRKFSVAYGSGRIPVRIDHFGTGRNRIQWDVPLGREYHPCLPRSAWEAIAALVLVLMFLFLLLLFCVGVSLLSNVKCTITRMCSASPLPTADSS